MTTSDYCSVAKKDIASEFADVITIDAIELGTLPGIVQFIVERRTEPKALTPKLVPIGLKHKRRETLKNWSHS